MKKKIHLLLILLAIFCLTACQPEGRLVSTKKAQSQAAINAAESQGVAATTISTAAPTPTAAVINPLTGVPAAAPGLLERRPVMVKVSNYPQYGRPHAGLSFADLVFDYYIGSGTNRFLALFYGQDAEQIGPVRSGRFVDAELVSMYNGVLAYGSADEDTDAELVTRLGDYAISNMEAADPFFLGTDTHSVVGVFANSAALTRYVDGLGLPNGKPDLPGMYFSQTAPHHGQIGAQVNVLFNYYNRAEWRYDATSGKYLRWIEYFEEGETDEFQMIPLVDRVNGQQLAFSNVIILMAEYTELASSRHLIDIWGNDKGKPAYYFRDGQMYTGSWRALHDTDPIQFFNDEGQPMALKPGNSWIVIAGLSSTFQEISAGAWELFFFLP